MKKATINAKNKIEDAIKPKTLEKRASTRNSLLRLFFVVVIIIAEIMLIMALIHKFSEKYTWIATLARVLGLMFVIYIYSQNKTAAVKMPWIILILLNPIIGIMLFMMVGLSGSTYRMRRRYQKVDDVLFDNYLRERPCLNEEIRQQDKSVANMVRYISDKARFPAYSDSDIEFYSDASVALEAQKEAMRRAKKFIFLEYHAIEDKEAFAEIKDILAEKAAEGLDVRVFYDDMGSITFISGDFIRIMEELGVKCRAFNPVTPIVNFFLNNRDHRKIAVIDGKVGFTGGYNLANEYFNVTHPYGQWKDTGVKITGPAVRNLTMMFLEMWNAIRGGDSEDVDYSPFFPRVRYKQKEPGAIIQPYGDSPLDGEHVGQNVYLNIIEAAQDYVWISTPYLIITDEMNHALSLAAERGVDVRIATPGIPDKVTVYSVTRSYYQRLVRNGVRIYEYTPGFLHAKQCVSDGKVATCGTINLDFRSLFHHFEDGCLFYNCRAVADVQADFASVFAVSREVTEDYKKGINWVKNIWRHLLRMFSALL